MADTTKKKDEELDAESAAKEAVKATDSKEDAESFDHDWLIDNGGAAIGSPPHVVAGALAGVTKKNLTIEETKAAVKAWLKAPVKTEE